MPTTKKDKRYQLDPRAPAQKRGRDPNSPKGSAKWQQFEVESKKRDREGEEPKSDKVHVVEDTKPADLVEPSNVKFLGRWPNQSPNREILCGRT